MEPAIRSRFNADFTQEKYAALLRCVNEAERWPADFRLSETPIFLTREFTEEVTRAAREIADLTQTRNSRGTHGTPFPKGSEVPNEPKHPNFLVVDFGICEVGGRLVPRLMNCRLSRVCIVSNCSNCTVCERSIPPFRETGLRLLAG